MNPTTAEPRRRPSPSPTDRDTTGEALVADDDRLRTVDEHLATVLDGVGSMDPIEVTLLDAQGLLLAEDVTSDLPAAQLRQLGDGRLRGALDRHPRGECAGAGQASGRRRHRGGGEDALRDGPRARDADHDRRADPGRRRRGDPAREHRPRLGAGRRSTGRYAPANASAERGRTSPVRRRHWARAPPSDRSRSPCSPRWAATGCSSVPVRESASCPPAAN